MWLFFGFTFCIVLVAKCSELVSFQEAAFQGRCDHGSACDQLCYELHDGMYECACTYGYQLNTNGYSCQEINSTYQANDNANSNSEEDVLYQRGASFSAELDVNNNTILLDTNNNSNNKQQDTIQNSENIANTNVVSQVDDNSKSDYDDDKVNDDGGRWIIDGNERLNTETTTSAPMAKITATPSTILTNPLRRTTSTASSSSSNVGSASETININKGNTTVTITTATTTIKNNQNILHVKKDFHLTIGSSKIVNDLNTDDSTKSVTNAEYYQYYTDDSVKSKLDVPHFSEKSWMAFPVLRGAYKYVQLQFEFKPEKLNGVILLTGERDDLTGDFIAVLMNNGFVEFWFDCGSGIGKVVSAESVILNQWNTLIVYRYRWDAWILLNQGKRVQGRSKGLFSRITFREPIFLGGTGNITGIDKKISVSDGYVGCIRKFTANEQEYIFSMAPLGNVTQIFDVHECASDNCDKSSYRQGKRCLTSDQDTIPSFNGSSYLTFAPLGDKSLIWFELKMVFKAKGANGILLYSGHDENGDFIALSLVNGYVEFMFDLGSGAAVLRNTFQLSLGKWHEIHVSRTARLAVLKIDEHAEVMTISPKGFWHLSLPQDLYLGGVNNHEALPADLKDRGLFVGCIQKVEINGRPISIMSEAIGGSNVDDCPHACTTHPCGSLAKCIPKYDNYECVCSQFNDKCNKEMLTNNTKVVQLHVAKGLRTTAIPSTTTQIPATKRATIQLLEEDIRQQKPESPSLVNNQIEVSVMVPSIDIIEHDFLHRNAYDTYPAKDIYNDLFDKKSHVKHDNINKKQQQQKQQQQSHLPMKRKSKYSKRRNGVCFSGDESYFHYHDEETKRHIINYNVDLNLRMKTQSSNGLVLWAGPHSGFGSSDYLMLGIENGYLHLRFDLGSGEMNLEYNVTKINDGLWHRIRASRDSQQGTLEVDGGKPIKKISPGELRKLNADTVLYVGGMPDVTHYTKRKYHFGIVGCISEIVLSGELKLDLNNESHAKSHHYPSKYS